MSSSVTTITGEKEIRLADVDPAATDGLTEQEADRQFQELQNELRELHDLMMAAETHGLLLILQGMDAAGKDVTIENVAGALNPQAFRVKSFDKPTEEERMHHFLWRADVATPMVGEAVVFDRSYYEQAMPEELQGDVFGERRARRFEHIKAFERILADEGIIVIKVFLHIGKVTQEQRLENRQNEIDQAWKLSPSDWKKHRQWDVLIEAYETVLNGTATPDIPWHVVPADHRWYHNPAVARIVVERLREHREQWEASRREIGEQNRKEAQEARAEGV
ncbi:MAG TPA: PPK2 family polyphosphate kinase [Thermomicrobiales bacterium]|nr:PPK2 family polyphosphate kinase [Thermomicrobiales bacterium]